MSIACSRWMNVVSEMVDFATTYIVFVVGSMTGVPVMPICGTMSAVEDVAVRASAFSPAPAPWAASISDTCHKGEAFAPPLESASKAIDRIVFGRDEEDVVGRAGLSGACAHREVGVVEGLRVGIAVDGVGEKLAEGRWS